MAISKPEFIGLRTTVQQRQTLRSLAIFAGQPGNMSAGLRWWIDRAPVLDDLPDNVEIASAEKTDTILVP